MVRLWYPAGHEATSKAAGPAAASIAGIMQYHIANAAKISDSPQHMPLRPAALPSCQCGTKTNLMPKLRPEATEKTKAAT